MILSRLHSFRSWPEPLLQILESCWRSGVRLGHWRTQLRERAGNWPLKLPVPVISVGNIAVGGTGKTPITQALACHWISQGGKPGIVSRGYRGGTDGNDEYQMLKKCLPEVPHFQNRCRYKAGTQLLEQHPETDLILIDDGFQHRRLYRDLDVVLLDGMDPLGGGHCLPRGLLREPWQNLARADHLILTRVERCDEKRLDESIGFLQQWFPDIPRWQSRTEVKEFRSLDPTPVPSDPGLAHAFCGIGDPDSFRHTLESQDWQLTGHTAFGDHHRYTRGDVENLNRRARSEGASFLICTAKDAVKIEPVDRATIASQLPILVVEIAPSLDMAPLLADIQDRSSAGKRELPTAS